MHGRTRENVLKWLYQGTVIQHVKTHAICRTWHWLVIPKYDADVDELFPVPLVRRNHVALRFTFRISYVSPLCTGHRNVDKLNIRELLSMTAKLEWDSEDRVDVEIR